MDLNTRVKVILGDLMMQLAQAHEQIEALEAKVAELAPAPKPEEPKDP